jgi:hypothetical protein
MASDNALDGRCPDHAVDAGRRTSAYQDADRPEFLVPLHRAYVMSFQCAPLRSSVMLFTEALYFSTRTADTLYSGHFELSSALDDKSALTFVDGK